MSNSIISYPDSSSSSDSEFYFEDLSSYYSKRARQAPLKISTDNNSTISQLSSSSSSEDQNVRTVIHLPDNFIDMADHCRDHHKSYDFLISINLVHNDMICCDGPMEFNANEDKFFKSHFYCVNCKSTKNVLFGSIFYKKRQSPVHFLFAIVSYKTLTDFGSIATQAKMRRETVRRFIHKLLSALSDALAESTAVVMVGGRDKTVQCDVVTLNRGNDKRDVLFFYDELDQVLTHHVLPCRSSDAIVSAFATCVTTGSKVVTDQSKFLFKATDSPEMNRLGYEFFYIDRANKVYHCAGRYNLGKLGAMIRKYRQIMKGVNFETRFQIETRIFMWMKNSHMTRSEIIDAALSLFQVPPQGENKREFRNRIGVIVAERVTKIKIRKFPTRMGNITREELELFDILRRPHICSGCLKTVINKIFNKE